MVERDREIYQVPLFTGRFHLQFASPFAPSPFVTTTFRGGLGYVLRKLVCGSPDKRCDQCLIACQCAYRYLYETTPHEGAEMMRKYNHVPHPYLLYCAPDSSAPTDHLSVQATLIGNATQFLPHLIYAFLELGKQGLGRDHTRYVLQKVTLDGDDEPIYRENDVRIRGDLKPRVYRLQPLSNSSEEPMTLQIQLESPLRLVYRERLLNQPLFEPFMASLLRRISALLHFHCNQTLDLDFADIVRGAAQVAVIRDATRWQEQQRYSTRQKEKMKMGGLVGVFDIKGNLSPYMDFLRLGQYIHNGKGTVFGLGKYSLKEVEG